MILAMKLSHEAAAASSAGLMMMMMMMMSNPLLTGPAHNNTASQSSDHDTALITVGNISLMDDFIKVVNTSGLSLI